MRNLGGGVEIIDRLPCPAADGMLFNENKAIVSEGLLFALLRAAAVGQVE